MNTTMPAILVAATLVCGCSSIERSRSLGNPAVPAATLAQQVCSNCHGITGNSVSPNFPKLAAQQSEYLVRQLQSFRAKNRSDPAGFEYMWGLSQHLSDSQIEGLAAYYAGQTSAPNAPADARLVAIGEKIFENGVASKNIPACATCHGPQAEGKDNYPRLADQHADYVVKQLLVFQRTDDRPEGAVMKVVAHDLTRDEIEGVAEYLQSFHARQ